MQNHKIIQKIGKWSILLSFGWVFTSLLFMGIGLQGWTWVQANSYASVQFSAQLDQSKIGLNEAVTLRMRIESDHQGNVSQPQFNAPEFDLIQQSSSISIRSEYDSSVGKFNTVKNTEVIRVLRPQKKGRLKISGIHVVSDGKAFHAPDLWVDVGEPVNVTQSPQSGFSGATPFSPRGNRPHLKPQAAQAPFVLRAEVDRKELYKGEQLVVSYVLYYQGKLLHMEIQKFPELVGFLKEDLAVPVMTQRLNAEMATLNGVPYTKSLLLKYAVYPLQEGQLIIDPLALKYEHLSSRSRDPFGGDSEDLFFHMLQPMIPEQGVSKSEPITIRVLPLPEAGKPKSFSGGVGEFHVLAAVNKYEVHANEAVTLTLKVDGKGNLSSLKEPEIVWPNSIDAYDSKAKVINSAGGEGSKIFEYLLIPRVPGQYSIPSLSLSFFNPQTKTYYTQSSEPIALTVLPPLPGSAADSGFSPSQPQVQNQKRESSPPSPSIRGIKPPQVQESEVLWHPLWRILYWAFSLAFAVLVFLICKDLISQKKQEEASLAGRSSWEKSWKELQGFIVSLPAQASDQMLSRAYDLLYQVVMGYLDEKLSLHSQALSRAELQECFHQVNLGSSEDWHLIESLLDHLDQVKYSGISQKDIALHRLNEWVSALEKVMIKTKSSQSGER